MIYKNDFPMLKKNIVYFDNAATTFKTNDVIKSTLDYYSNYTSNANRGDYNISFKVSDEIDKTRESVQKFINASRKEEIVFTYGTTDSINMVVNGFFLHQLNKGDEVLLSKSEHASNILPWLILSKKIGVVIKYIPLTEDNKISLENIESIMSNKTKVISLSHITNVVGDIRDIKGICSLAHKNNVYVLVDAAQSVSHIKVDVNDLDCDFLAFSAHKMCGPTGVGILYGKYELLDKMIPVRFGGGMNEYYNEKELSLSHSPEKFEAGTANICGIISFKHSIEYLEKVGIENIFRTEKYLRRYLINELESIPHVKIYNKNSEGSIVLINVKGILSGDLGLYLNSKGICVRSGLHCVKMLKDVSDIEDTVRISLSFYNTYEEIDYLISILRDRQGIMEYVN